MTQIAAGQSLVRHELTHPDGRTFYVYGALRGTLANQPADRELTALHLRFDAVTQTWVAISPARNSRPVGPDADTTCPLCPGGPELPFDYDSAVFDNRFPALSNDASASSDYGTATSAGRCQVVVYTSEHNGSLSSLGPELIARVVAIWRDRTTALWAQGHQYVMAFENHGVEVGATLPHPHGQVYAFGHVPPTVRIKTDALTARRHDLGTCLNCDLVLDDDTSERIICHNDTFTVAVPFAARWPYEVSVRARRHGLGRLSDMTNGEAIDLARAVSEVVTRYDGLFGFELPYMMCVQEAPSNEPDWHLHIEFLPPHRNANTLKVRASVETVLGVFINDTLPERSAQRLASVGVPTTSWHEVAVPAVITAQTAGSTAIQEKG